ncbi:MAG: DUF4190 domain-containing protein [Acidimicrobiia bacterium]
MTACPHCGQDVSPRAASCPACGEPGPAAPRPGTLAGAVTAAARTDGYAIASIACSAAAFFGAFIVGSIAGVVFGRMAQARIAADPTLQGEGLAQAGIILGWVGVVVGGLFLVFVLTLFSGFLWF